MNKIYRILGKRGRITIPYDIRKKLGYSYNDIISFEEKDNAVVVKREKICDRCGKTEHNTTNRHADEIPLLSFLDGLSPDEQRTALIHLSVRWAAQHGGKPNA